MNKDSFIAICNAYKEYRKLNSKILDTLNLIDDDDVGAVITPIKECFYIIIDNELSYLPEEFRDFIVETIEDFIYEGRVTVPTGEIDEGTGIEGQKYLCSFSDIYDAFI